MRRPNYPPRDELSESGSMTPMIDVVFLLLIFFVCTALGQVREDLLPMDLPPGDIEMSAAPPEDAVPIDRLFLYLSRSGEGRTLIELNEHEHKDLASLGEVLTAIAELDAASPVVLEIEDEVPAGDWIPVYDLCSAAGFKSISLATDRPVTQ